MPPLGPDVTEHKVGDSVCALVTGGGYAEYCTASSALCLRPPKRMDFIHCAALPESLFTVWSNVFTRGHLRKGEKFLVHGGTSGIGTTAIQLANRWGAEVYTTAGSAEKCKICEQLGAYLAINYQQEDFVERIKEATGGRGVDVILDIVGGDYLQRNLSTLAMDGRLVQIAFQHGPKTSINLVPIMLKRLTLTGSTLRARSDEDKAVIANELCHKVWPLLDDQTIAPRVDSTFPLESADKAHRLMESSQHIGKIILTTKA